MTFSSEIKQAIGAHVLWRTRLIRSIHAGGADLDPEEVSSDDTCKFSQWLNGPTLTGNHRNSPHYRKVIEIHAALHALAGHAVNLARSGRHQEAIGIVGTDGALERASTQLTQAMIDWERDLVGRDH